MSTDRLFNSMLNQYLPVELLKEELVKRDYLLQKVNMDKSWNGGELIIPFQGQNASSVEFGALPASNDLSAYSYIRGSISVQPEVWSTLYFNERDLFQNQGKKMPEQTFLKMLPDQIDGMIDYFKMVLSTHLLGGPEFATLTVDGTSGGIIEVDRVDRFTLSQKVSLQDGNTAATTYYVIAIDVNAGTLGNGTVTLSTTRGGSAAAGVANFTVAQSAKVYHPGAQTAGMTSLTSQLLSLANGGSTNLFGTAKTAYSYLQAVQIDGTAVSASNILGKIFDGYTKRQRLAKSGKIPEVLMSYKHFGSILKLVDTQKGPFNVVPNSRTASNYGWQTLQIGSVSGEILTLVAIQEMSDSVIHYLDWDGITFYSNDLIYRRKDPGDGKEFFTSRATTGYTYIVDHVCAGDLVVHAPWKQAIMYGIPNY